MGRRAKPSKGKAEAKRPLARKSPKVEDSRVRDLEKRLADALKREAESLDQQKATSEILRVISRSPTNLQPVLDAIATNAALVCDAYDAVVFLREDDRLRTAAHYGPITITLQHSTLSRGSVTEVAILDRQPVHVHDVLATEPPVFPLTAEAARRGGFRTVLSVPLLRENEAIGALAIRRREVQPFTTQQIDLLKTFADQAVIAIENARLFKELATRNKDLTEALEQQTATGEILRVIASSPTDVEPVLMTVAERAARLCAANDAMIFRKDGNGLQLVARWGSVPAVMTLGAELAMDRTSVVGRAVIDARVIHIPDVQRVFDEFASSKQYMGASGVRTALAVPLLREGVAIGAILIRRLEVEPFADKQIGLLTTFADQAVIAIENVRLFNETKEALEQQTATSEILRVIASSPTDVRPVFEAILKRAATLCEAQLGHLWLYEGGEQFRLGAGYGSRPDHLQWLQQGLHRFGRPFFRESGPWRVGQVLDVRDTEPYRRGEPVWIRTADHEGMRTLLAVPLVKDGRLVGSIAVYRREVQPFTDQQTALVQTFADQAVIAIENVRLFKELEVANRELAAASQHKSEFLANMSHELRTPLNAIIGFSEVLSERMFGELNQKQEEYSKDIHASGQHLLSLINDILDLSKIEAGRMELELTDFHFPTALDNALTLVRERAGRRSITLEMSVDERLGEVRADERKIRQVVLNLLSNAIKFTPEGGRINVDAVPKDGLLEVSVTDTGVGIAPEDQEAVFEEFRQVGTADKKVEGTGLGLALCRKFIELHGGRIWVTSQVGAGSTFTFTLPVRREK